MDDARLMDSNMRHWIRLLMFLLMLALPFQQAAAALSCCPANACGHGAAAQAATAKTHSSATLDMALATAPPGHLTPLAAHRCSPQLQEPCCTRARSRPWFMRKLRSASRTIFPLG